MQRSLGGTEPGNMEALPTGESGWNKAQVGGEVRRK